MRRFLGFVGVTILLAFAILTAVLVEAHWEMSGLSPALPEISDISALAESTDGPISISYINTASQSLPESKSIAHPAFLVEWTDGRTLMIDAGMDKRQAEKFGKRLETLAGATPTKAFGSVAEQMGSSINQIDSIAFTHLHPDHTNGVLSLCQALKHDISLFQTTDQAVRGNYSTRAGQDFLLAADCLQATEIPPGSLSLLSNFPGVAVMPAAGHTPGSTIYIVPVGGITWIISGDVSNTKYDLLHDIPKQFLYSLLLVPESTQRLTVLRRWLAALDARDNMEVIVSHDLAATKASGMQAWQANEP